MDPAPSQRSHKGIFLETHSHEPGLEHSAGPAQLWESGKNCDWARLTAHRVGSFQSTSIWHNRGFFTIDNFSFDATPHNCFPETGNQSPTGNRSEEKCINERYRSAPSENLLLLRSKRAQFLKERP